MFLRGESWRFWIPVILLAGFAGYCAQKLIRAHVDPDVGDVNYKAKRILPAARGTIYDGCTTPHPLSISVPIWEYRLDPVALTNAVVRPKGEKHPRKREHIVRTIANELGLDYGELLKRSYNAANRYQFLASSDDPNVNRVLRDSKFVAGIAIENRQERRYLQGRMLSHVIGSVNAEFTGSAGAEQKFNRDLTGVDGWVRYFKDAHGRELFDHPVERVDAIAGRDIYLTVDHNMQYEAEAALKEGIAEYGAGSGWCIVMDSRTGAILVMASNPDFDPKEFGRSSDSQKLNRACGLVYEPGSVMKVITAAAAIDCGRVGPDTMYNTDQYDKRYYKLPGDHGHVWPERMSVADAIAHSSNIVIGKLGCDLGRERLYEYMKRFGFGARTGIELPGEEVGILPNWNNWDKASWSRAPIGQFVAVTAIQLASAYQAIANDGVRMKPYIINRIVEADGTVVSETSPHQLGMVVSAKTARTMREIMRPVATVNGTARRAAIKGYSIAGKTGTAQKANGKHGYIPNLYRATFCGIVPAAEPRFVVLVTLDFDQKVLYHQGGNSAAPVFRKITEALLKYYHVPPDMPDELDFDDD